MDKLYFNLLGETTLENINEVVNTAHFKYERQERLNRAFEALGGYGTAKASFLVDCGHINGNEIHTLTDNGFIIIQNANTKKLITILIARHGQVTRYFPRGVRPDCMCVLNSADRNERMGYNYF